MKSLLNYTQHYAYIENKKIKKQYSNNLNLIN